MGVDLVVGVAQRPGLGKQCSSFEVYPVVVDGHFRDRAFHDHHLAIETGISVPVGIEDKQNDIFCDLYPNPADGQLSLSISAGSTTNASILIYRLTGDHPVYESNIRTHPGTHSHLSINTGHWAPGVYVCRVKTSASEKMMKLVVRH